LRLSNVSFRRSISFGNGTRGRRAIAVAFVPQHEPSNPLAGAEPLERQAPADLSSDALCGHAKSWIRLHGIGRSDARPIAVRHVITPLRLVNPAIRPFVKRMLPGLPFALSGGLGSFA